MACYLAEEEDHRLPQTLPEKWQLLVEVGLLTRLRASEPIGLR